jgi:two-component system, sensor histidine kinase PdtaS
MTRYLPIVWLFLSSSFAMQGQSPSGAAAIANYSASQKRLLVVTTSQFINFLTQNNLDQDTVMAMAARITGIPFLTPYTGSFRDHAGSVGTDLINTGKIYQAIQLLNKLEGQKQIQLLLELGIWYLHQPGARKSDLDSADHYIQAASRLSLASKYDEWGYECLYLRGEWYHQGGDVAESKKVFLQIVSASQLNGNRQMLARTYQRLGEILPYNDSMRLTYFNKSLELYQALQLKENEIELLGNIASYHRHSGPYLVEKDLRDILSLQQSTGFKHVLYTQYQLAHALVLRAKYLEALEYANAALATLKWSGISALTGSFLMRVGTCYESLGKKEEALSWFRQSLAIRSGETHFFWYKSLIFASELLVAMNRAKESLLLLDTITGEFPPVTMWEKVQVLSEKGDCHQKLQEPLLADENYMTLLDMTNDPAFGDEHEELLETYCEIARFYISERNLKKAGLFLKKVLASTRKDLFSSMNKYFLLYKIDSLKQNYQSALQQYIHYKYFYDSLSNLDQRTKLDGLTLQYATAKKDENISLLMQQALAQKTELRQNKLTRNIMIVGTALLLIIVGLLFRQYKIKQRTNKEANIANAALVHMVEEKEWLLKEIHHRVKNNLQIVVSLLNTQSKYLVNDEAVAAMSESRHRMQAMSLIHQKLYSSDNLALVNMPNYIKELVEYLGTSFRSQKQISFELAVDPIDLDISQAIPVGLILNEAITNAIKHAFANKKDGKIMISMKYLPAQGIDLRIRDNGSGLAAGIDLPAEGSMGMRLIEGLVGQIDGTLTIKNERGFGLFILFHQDRALRAVTS